MNIEVKDIKIEEILFSGACFRCIKEEDGSITNILKDRIVNLKQDGNIIHIKSNNYDNLKEVIYDYFDLNRDYDSINKALIKNDKRIEKIIKDCKNYRILNQDSFEMCISYIISQNNNVKRISKSIDKLCIKYGKEIIYDNKKYYLFPKYEDIKKISLEELRDLGIGFRDKYIRDFLDKYESLRYINSLSTKEALDELMKVKGIGLKVASCILLFGYKRLDVFPIDTWVKHYISENFDIKDDQKSIEKFARDTFKDYSGLVIQYMFHSQRNIN